VGCGKRSGIQRANHGYCNACWDVAQYSDEFGTPCLTCQKPFHKSQLKGGKCSICEHQGSAFVCRECGSKMGAFANVGFCNDCWSVAQFREEYGTPCSGCGKKHHASQLKDGKCAGCGLGRVGAAVAVAAEPAGKKAAVEADRADRDGAVLVFGSNAYGQLGIGAANVSVFTLLPFKHTVKAIACGLMHSAVVTDAGELWTWGRNMEGQLGLGDRKERSTPCRVTYNRTVADVSCGNYHTLLVDSFGEVADSGREQGHVAPVPKGRPNVAVAKDGEFAPVAGVAGAKLIAAAGNASCVYSQTAMQVYMWGWGGGRGHVNTVPALSGKMVEVLCGSKFEILVGLTDGRIVSIRNDEVASEHLFDINEVKELQVLRGFTELSVGNATSGAITLSGEAVMWKRNNSTGAMSTEPVRIADHAFTMACGGSSVITINELGAQMSNGEKVRGRFCRVACGQYHSMLLTGPFAGSTSFAADAQALLQSGQLADMSLRGVPCHSLFLRASNLLPLLERLEVAFENAPENLVKAFLVFVYTDRLSLDSESSEQLLRIVGPLGEPKRLVALLARQPVEPGALTQRLLRASESTPGDVTLLCEDGSVTAHLCLLAARSSYFAAATSERWGERRMLTIPYSADAARVLVRFCCGASLPEALGLIFENVADVLQLASEYATTSLYRIVEAFLMANLKRISNLAELKELAELLQREGLVFAIKALI
jgi:hypothetical protein